MRTGLLSGPVVPRMSFRGAEPALAALVILVLGLMIVPVPTWMLDILIGANLSLAVVVLLVAVFVREPLAVATFPTVLLLTTLFRLGLNIASTRLILLQANAGEVIRSFGEFVVRGNFVVGAVVFLILTIIQFVVVVKGAERVAEVGARFALDAMPGKQMAIDAELRAGAIDSNEARRRRRTLARESQFYGAMDGAMKFVKGDVIASLIIVLINLIGGLLIGILQRHMDASSALRRYGILSIGDGLVSQIPSMVIALAAGVLVTRVASEDENRSLGDELLRQFFGIPRALFFAAGFVLLLGLVPGLPALPFLIVAPLLFLAGRLRVSADQRAEHSGLQSSNNAMPAARDRDAPFLSLATPWLVEVSDDLAPMLEPDLRSGGAPTLRVAMQGFRDRLFMDLGVCAPSPRLAATLALPPVTVQLLVYDIPVVRLTLADNLHEGASVPWIAERLYSPFARRASDFVGMAEVQRTLDLLEGHIPAAVRNVVPKPISLVLLVEVLRRLVDEGFSIRDMRAVLEALAQAPQGEKDPLHLAELVRAYQKRAVTHRLTQGEARLSVVTIDPLIEDTIRRSIQHTAGGSFIALSPSAMRDVLSAIRRALEGASSHWETGLVPVVLTQPDIRRFVRKILEVEFPYVFVTSFAELQPELALTVIAKALPTE